MATSDYQKMQAHLVALAEREAEAQAELKEATDRVEKVRAMAIAGELQRIARRRGEIVLAMPKETEAERTPKRKNRGD